MNIITIKAESLFKNLSQKPTQLAKTLIKPHKKLSSINLQKKLTKIKIMFFTIIILLIFKFYTYCSIKTKEEENVINSFKKYENEFLRYFQSLKNISYDNTSFLKEYREKILEKLSKKLSKNVTSIDNLYLDYYLKFGNQLINFNKAIFYCEILKCKKIFVHPLNNFLFIIQFMTNNLIFL